MGEEVGLMDHHKYRTQRISESGGVGTAQLTAPSTAQTDKTRYGFQYQSVKMTDNSRTITPFLSI
jgi:hypothetical protein